MWQRLCSCCTLHANFSVRWQRPAGPHFEHGANDNEKETLARIVVGATFRQVLGSPFGSCFVVPNDFTFNCIETKIKNDELNGRGMRNVARVYLFACYATLSFWPDFVARLQDFMAFGDEWKCMWPIGASKFIIRSKPSLSSSMCAMYGLRFSAFVLSQVNSKGDNVEMALWRRNLHRHAARLSFVLSSLVQHYVSSDFTVCFTGLVASRSNIFLHRNAFYGTEKNISHIAYECFNNKNYTGRLYIVYLVKMVATCVFVAARLRKW